VVLAHLDDPSSLLDHAAVKHLVQNWAGDFVDEEYSRLRIAAEKFYGFVLLVSRRLLLLAFNSSQVAV